MADPEVCLAPIQRVVGSTSNCVQRFEGRGSFLNCVRCLGDTPGELG